MKSWYSTEKAFSPIGCGINDKSCRFMIIWRMLDICLTTTWQLTDVSMSIYICFLDSCLITSWQLLDNYLSTDDWHAIVITCLTIWRLLYNFKADFEKKTTRQIRVRWWQCYKRCWQFFRISDTPLPHAMLAVFLVLSVCNFDQFLTPHPLPTANIVYEIGCSFV